MYRSLELSRTGFGFHCPSVPGNMSVITANLQDMGGMLSVKQDKHTRLEV
jgi:hypothetical protein